jgi:hypothetical protein
MNATHHAKRSAPVSSTPSPHGLDHRCFALRRTAGIVTTAGPGHETLAQFHLAVTSYTSVFVYSLQNVAQRSSIDRRSTSLTTGLLTRHIDTLLLC